MKSKHKVIRSFFILFFIITTFTPAIAVESIETDPAEPIQSGSVEVTPTNPAEPVQIAPADANQANPVKTAHTDIFPVYPSIKPNVAFWHLIYTRYHSRQGLIHDSENLNIIYEVMDLLPLKTKGAKRLNRKRIKKVKNKYKQILRRLSKGIAPMTDEETRVLELFGENADPITLVEAMENIRFQRGQKDRFRDGLIRSGEYIDEIKRIFRSYELPEDLAYLPHVESSFSYNAYSKFGAAGIWQFTYGTGKQFMRVNYSVDERWDPIRATHAAAKLLRLNHKKLGSWALAITAYNHGVNSMLRAKKAKGEYENIFNEYNGRRFKFASRNFYSEFLAAREIAKNSVQYFGELTLCPPLQVEEVKMPGYVSAKVIAKYFEVDMKSIQKLNPALRAPVFKEQKYIPEGYILRLPVKKNISTLVAKMPKNAFKSKQKRSRFHWVRKGDVAGAIARRYGISLKDLILANNLNRRATIYAGQNLRIPSPNDKVLIAARQVESDKSSNEFGSKAESSGNDSKFKKAISDEANSEKISTDINPSVVTGNLQIRREFKKNGKRYGVIRVDTRETIGHYSEWLNVSANSLRRLNGLSFGKGLDFNDRIVIPLTKVNKEQFEEKRYEYHKEFEEDFLQAFKIENVWLYKVRKGDNIWGLCRDNFDLPFWLVRKYNTDVDLSRLMPHQKLVIPIIEKKE